MIVEIKNESTGYELTKNDLFIITELANKRNQKLFTGITFKLNDKVHIDFVAFSNNKVIICDNYLITEE
jgi:hypothetical protein